MFSFRSFCRAATLLALVCTLSLGATPVQAQPEGVELTFQIEPHHRLLDASALVRLNSKRLIVKDAGRATLYVRRVVTIFDADGREEAIFGVSYDDNLRHLKKFNGRVLDATGRVVRKLKKGDVEDVSAISGFSLYEQNRVRAAGLYHDIYPYTVDFSYELMLDGLVGWPDWYPQDGDLGVEYAYFEIDTPEEMAFSFATRHLDAEPAVESYKRRTRTSWTLSDLPATEREPMGADWTERAMAVMVSPGTFEVEGTRGDMSSWESFGSWYHTLSSGRDELSPTTIRDIEALTGRLPDVRSKAEAVYHYLQERTRYVSVQLGLGGWQPYDALYVDERGYGDCKALTNYLMALLRAADVTAYPALIHSGLYKEAVVDSFVTNRFNHVILYVPGSTTDDGQDIWLEATSQTIPFGHISASNEGRLALVVTPEGGTLRQTPRSAAATNRQVRHADIRLGDDGNAIAQITTTYTGNQQDRVRGNNATASGKDRLDWLRSSLDLATFDVVEADFSDTERRAHALSLPVTISVPRYAAKTGQRLFVPVNMLERWTYIPPALDERTQPIRHAYAFEDTDSLVYRLPLGYRVEAMPPPVSVATEFGSYSATLEVVDDETLVYHRSVEIRDTHIPASSYEAFRAFRRQVAEADQAQVVLVLDATGQPHAVDGNEE